MSIDFYSLKRNQAIRTSANIRRMYGNSDDIDLGRIEKGNNHILSSYKTEEDIAIDTLTKSEQIDQLIKGRAALPVGTRKTYGGKDYVKTAQGWKANKDVKDAHDKIHGEKKEEDIEIGKTKSGKSVLANKDASDYKDFDESDHADAEKLHHKEYLKLADKYGSKWSQNRTGSNSPEYIKADHHRHMGMKHSKFVKD